MNETPLKLLAKNMSPQKKQLDTLTKRRPSPTSFPIDFAWFLYMLQNLSNDTFSIDFGGFLDLGVFGHDMSSHLCFAADRLEPKVTAEYVLYEQHSRVCSFRAFRWPTFEG